MTEPPRRSPLGQLWARPRRFTFDAALRVLAFASRRPDPAQSARFASVPGLAYPGADVTAAQPGTDGRPAALTTAVMGLTGPSGVLPRHYTEAVVLELRGRSGALQGFLDMLSHRMVSFFARSGSKYRPHRAADEAALRGNADPNDAGPVAGVLLALTGYGTPGLAARLPTGPEPLRHYAGLFSARPRSADRLEALVSDWLGRPVQVEQFVGAWLPLPPDQRTQLGQGLWPGRFNRLGEDAAVGVRAWDPAARIVLRVGPLGLAEFQALLPDRPALRELVALVRAYVGFEVEFAINPVLARDAVPPLAMRADAAAPARLGWTTWTPVGAGITRTADAADAVFEAGLVEKLDG